MFGRKLPEDVTGDRPTAKTALDQNVVSYYESKKGLWKDSGR